MEPEEAQFGSDALPQVLQHSLGIQKLAVVPALKCAWSGGGSRCWWHTGCTWKGSFTC